MNNYKGFSKQDLEDRWGALQSELEELVDEAYKVRDERNRIEKILEE